MILAFGTAMQNKPVIGLFFHLSNTRFENPLSTTLGIEPGTTLVRLPNLRMCVSTQYLVGQKFHQVQHSLFTTNP